MTTRLFINIGELTTNDPTLGDESPSGRFSNAAMVVDEQHVLWVGSTSDAPDGDEMTDVDGAAVTPGFVDSHTRLRWLGCPSRCQGQSKRSPLERLPGGRQPAGVKREVEPGES